MKKLTALLAVVAAAAGICSAAEEAASSYSVTADFPFVSKYVFRGQQIAKESFQPSVEATIGDFYVGVWGEVPFKKSERISREIDVYAGYNIKISDALKAEVSVTHYAYPTSGASSDTTEASFGLNWTLGALTPALTGYYDFDLKTWTAQGSLGYSLPLKEIGTSLDWNATFGGVTPDHGDSYTYFSVGVTVPYKLSDKAKVNLGVSYATNSIDGAKDPGLWYTAGLTLAF